MAFLIPDRGGHVLALIVMAILPQGCGGSWPLPPPGAVPVGDERYFVPLGADSAGCLLFGMWSATRAVDMAIRWRRADGSFVFDRPQDCVRPAANETRDAPSE